MSLFRLTLGHTVLAAAAAMTPGAWAENPDRLRVGSSRSLGFIQVERCLAPAYVHPQARPRSTRRARVPEPSSIQSAELRIRQEFREEYALTTPQEKAGFANLLLGVASEKGDDSGTRYVLLREAVRIASEAGDLATSLWAIDRISAAFEMDVRPLRERVLSEAARTAAMPEDFWRLAQGYLTLAEEAVAFARSGQVEDSAKEAAAYSAKAKSTYLLTRANALLKDVREHGPRYDKTRKALENLVMDPSNPEANLIAGQHACFVRDDWENGLPQLAKGSDPVIKGLAERDLANPNGATERVTLGDGWWILGDTRWGDTRDPLRRRADFWYRKAADGLSVDLRKRLAQRHREVEDRLLDAPAVDLLQLIDPKRDTVLGDWGIEGQSLVCREELIAARLQVPYLPPEEYDLGFVAERTSGCEAINVGLSQGTVQFSAVIDGYSKIAYASGLARIDGKYANENETTRRGPLLVQGRPSTIECSVRKTGVSMRVNGKPIFEWSGEFRRLSLYDALKTPHPRALFISAWDSKYRFSSILLVPISGKGEVLR